MRDIFSPAEVLVCVARGSEMRMRESFVNFARLREQSMATYIRRYPESSTLQGTFSFTNPYGDAMTIVNVLTPQLAGNKVGLVTVALDEQQNVIGLETTEISRAHAFTRKPDTAVRQGISTAAKGYATALAMIHEQGLVAFAADRKRDMVISGGEMATYARRREQKGEDAYDEACNHYEEVRDDAYWGENGMGRYHYTGRRDHAFTEDRPDTGMEDYMREQYAKTYKALIDAEDAREKSHKDNETFAYLTKQFGLATKTVLHTEEPIRRGQVVRKNFELQLQRGEPLSEITLQEVSEALGKAWSYNENIVA